MVLITQGTGEGLTHPDDGDFIWGGHSFNPTGDTDCGYQDFNAYSSWSTQVSLYNASTSFDLSGYQYGNEVVLYLATVENDTPDAITASVVLRFRDPDGNLCFQIDYGSFNMPSGYWYQFWIGMGIKDYVTNEIHKNGIYVAQVAVTIDGSTTTEATNFTVSNYPTVTSSTSVGSIWVEGDNLAYICGQQRKIVAKHDGTSSFVGTTYSGSIWMESAGKLTYIDSSGYKRSTKLGDKYGITSQTTEIPKTPGTTYKGSAWISTGFHNTYILIVGSDGVSYRIGPGYVGSGDYQ